MAKEAFDKNWEKPAFKGVLLQRTSNQSIAPSGTVLSWQVKRYDTNNFWSSATNPTRITIRPGISWIKLSSGVQLENGPSLISFVFRKNGTAFFQGNCEKRVPTPPSGYTSDVLLSAPLNVVEGDYFEVELAHNYGGNRNALYSDFFWFSMEVLS